MKNNILLFTALFIGIYAFTQEEPTTIVPENPEKLVNDSIDIQSGTIKNLQQAQERIDKLDSESKRLTNEYKDTIEILTKLFINHAGIIICGPEYNGSTAPIITNSIAWISCSTDYWKDAFKNKIALSCPGEGCTKKSHCNEPSWTLP